MRPDAALFSPRNGASTPVDTCTALVPHEEATYSSVGEVSDSFSVKSTNDTPRDLIMHESIKGLLAKVDKLQIRCTALETTNNELKSEMLQLKVTGAVHETYRSANGNFTGYSSSTSNNGSEVAHVSSTEMGELKSKIEIISEILADYDQRFGDQITQQQAAEKRFDRNEREQTWLRGLFGKLKKDVNSLEEKFGYADDGNDRGRSSGEAGHSTSNPVQYFNDELDQVRVGLTELTLNCEKQHTELDNKCAALATVVESGSMEEASRGEQSHEAQLNNFRQQIWARKNAETMKALQALERWQGGVRRVAKNKQYIDDASTRDALDAMFFQLSKIMTNNDGGTLQCEGAFEATPDEAFQLRDRVICRLALFDQYATALQNVQAKKGNVHW